MPDKNEALEHGMEVMRQVYGPALAEATAAKLPNDYIYNTITHLFGEIWARPQLSIRDRRLLVLGVTMSLGDPELIRIMISSAIRNGELTDQQIDELPVFLSYYAGWGRTRKLTEGIQQARAQIANERSAAR